MSAQDANSVVLTGYVVADPELKQVGENNKELTTFSIAVQGSYESTSYFELKYWGVLATRVNKAVKKGSRVICYGRLSQEKWQDKEGKNRSAVVVVGSGFEFLRGGAKKKEETTADATTEGGGDTPTKEGKDIPFPPRQEDDHVAKLEIYTSIKQLLDQTGQISDVLEQLLQAHTVLLQEMQEQQATPGQRVNLKKPSTQNF